MRTRRLLLAASALSTLTFGCAKDKPVGKTDEGTSEPLPGNPKGTFYDANLATPDPVPPSADAATPRDAAPAPPDAGVDAALDGPRDAPRDAAAVPRRPPDARIYANPKGAHYDKGQDPLD